MISRAIARFIRISPRKTRLVADMVRGKGIDEAQALLMNLQQRPRIYISQLLKSAAANASVKEPDISPSDLYISKITVDGGPMFKRYRAGSMGRAMMIRHRTSHILIELDRKQGLPVTSHQLPVKAAKKKAAGNWKLETKNHRPRLKNRRLRKDK